MLLRQPAGVGLPAGLPGNQGQSGCNDPPDGTASQPRNGNTLRYLGSCAATLHLVTVSYFPKRTKNVQRRPCREPDLDKLGSYWAPRDVARGVSFLCLWLYCRGSGERPPTCGASPNQLAPVLQDVVVCGCGGLRLPRVRGRR